MTIELHRSRVPSHGSLKLSQIPHEFDGEAKRTHAQSNHSIDGRRHEILRLNSHATTAATPITVTASGTEAATRLAVAGGSGGGMASPWAAALFDVPPLSLRGGAVSEVVPAPPTAAAAAGSVGAAAGGASAPAVSRVLEAANEARKSRE